MEVVIKSQVIRRHSRRLRHHANPGIASQIPPLAFRGLELLHVDSEAAALDAARAGRPEEVVAETSPPAPQQFAILRFGDVRRDAVLEPCYPEWQVGAGV